MSKLKIEGKNVLSGTIEISGAKNSAVALLPASLLCKTKSKIFKVPKIRDIEYLIKILEVLNCKCKIENNAVEIEKFNSLEDASNLKIGQNILIPFRMLKNVKQMPN